MAISYGGDPENYMDPPTQSHSGLSELTGVPFVAGLLDLLGIQRNVARGPKKPKTAKGASNTIKEGAGKTPQAGEWLDVAGASLASQDLTQNSGPLTPIILPPSSARQGI